LAAFTTRMSPAVGVNDDVVNVALSAAGEFTET
jgi:hypothetical protein